jgi:hypothetical protein
MTQEALKLALEALKGLKSMYGGNGHKLHEINMIHRKHDTAITALEEALAQTQEPVSNDPLPRACNLAGVDYQTFLKIKAYMPVAPPQRTWVGGGDLEDSNAYLTPPQSTERPVDCERCNRLEEQAYDLVGKLRVANIKLSMQPQRTWVGLTDDEIKAMDARLTSNSSFYAGALWAEAKLKEKNT